jgi:predicted phage terminase large subunit-like protein
VIEALAALTDEQLAALPPGLLAEFSAQAEVNLLLQSPADYAAGLSDGRWTPYRHLAFTSDAIVAMIEEDDCDLLVVDQPVRHGKTELCSRWTPAWYLSRYPQRRVLLASYEADFAATHGRRVRELVIEHGGRFGLEVDQTSRAANRWELTNGQGGMGTAGAGGPITGKGGHLLIVDDPIKNIEDAQSEVMRAKLWDWWQNVFLTRREPGAKVLLIMSRWHEDDLIGRLLAASTGMRIKRLRMPAVAETDDLLGRRPGDALCSERYPIEVLNGIRIDVGPTAWSALYQQRPIAIGGGMFRREHFRSWKPIPRKDDMQLYKLGDHLVDDAECWRFSTMDPAYSGTKRSDYTALATWAVAPTDPPSLMLLDIQRVRVQHAEHAPMVRRVWDQWKPAWVGVEKQSASLSLFDEVQRQGVVVRWLKPDKNKIARAETAVALVEAGRVYLPDEAQWLDEFLAEVVSFPVAAHDDQVDVLAYAAAELTKRTVRPRHMKKEPNTVDERCWAQLEKRAGPKGKYHPVIGKF